MFLQQRFAKMHQQMLVKKKNVELNISTKQVCQQHVPNICILGTIVEILLHSKESCRTRKFKIMRGKKRGEITAGKCIKEFYKKLARKIIFTEPFVTVNTTIYCRKGVCTKHDKQTYQQTLPKKQKHVAKLVFDVLCKKHVLYLENANIEEHCLIKLSYKMCPHMPPRTLLVHMNTWISLLD